jgi:PAS domain S-box-containing protein
MRYSKRTQLFERELLDANSTLRVFMLASPVPLMSVASDGTVKMWNTAAEKATGWNESEIVGKKHLDVPALSQTRFPELVRMIQEGTPVSSEGIQVKRKDGSRIDLSLSMAPIRNAKGETTGVITALVDLSDIRRTEEALRESQRVLSTLMRNLPGMAYRRVNDENWTMEFVSDGCLSLTGYHPSVFVGDARAPYSDIIYPQDRERVRKEVEAAMAESRPYTFEYRIVAADGSTKYVWEQGTGVEREGGRTTTLEGLVLDVTERRRADLALRESEERYRQLVESANSIIIMLDTSGRITSFNEFAVRFYGFERDEVIGMKASETIVPRVDSLGKDMSSMVDDIVRDPARFANNINENVKKDGTRVWVHWTNKVVRGATGEPVSLLAVGTDMTELTGAQRALEESEHRYRQLVEFSPDAILVYGDGVFVFANAAAVALLGGESAGDIVGKDWKQFFEPIDTAAIMEIVRKGTETVQEPNVLGVRFHRLDGGVIDAEAAAIRVSYRGNPAVLVVARDVTARKVAETERRIFEERLSALHYYDTELGSARNLTDVYEITMDSVQRTLGFEHAFFAKVRGEYLERAASRGQAGLLIAKLPLDGSQGGLIVRAARTHEPVLLPDVAKDEGYVMGIAGVRSELVVPVELEGQVLGVIDVESMELDAFDINDVKLLQILASHMAAAIGNLEQRMEIEKRSHQLAFLLRSSAQILRAGDVHERLQKITDAIKDLGWRRVVISARDENMDILSPDDLVTAGLSDEERDFLWKTASSGLSWKDRFGPEFERFKIGSFYYLPWSDPFVKEKTAQIGIASRLSPEQMVDWGPEDLLYTPLTLPDGRIIGILSVDDPVDGRRPTQTSLAPLELFIGLAAVALESARLFRELEEVRNEIREYAGQLEKNVEERSRELVEAQEKLLKAQRLATIGEVSAQVGHDLRNPLTSINTNLYYLQNVLPKKQKDKVDVTLDSMQNAVIHANRIVEDLLEYSRTAALKKKKLLLNSVLTSSMSSVLIPKNVSVHLKLEDEVEIDGDSSRLLRVFQNLVSNAVDAMPDGGSLTVSSAVGPKEVIVGVADTGAGIREENLALLFTPFFTTKSKGLGLGLAICKRLVEAHGGRIEVKSKVGEGTTISVALPLASAEGGAADEDLGSR